MQKKKAKETADKFKGRLKEVRNPESKRFSKDQIKKG